MTILNIIEAIFFGFFILFTLKALIYPLKEEIGKFTYIHYWNWIVPAIIGTIWYFIHLINV